MLGEVAHIVTHVAGDGPFVGLPSWLDEGQAVYSQRTPGPEYSGGLQLAISADQVLPLTSINSPVSQPSQVNAFYGQSWSTVKFMVDTYGKDKFAAVFKSVKGGSDVFVPRHDADASGGDAVNGYLYISTDHPSEVLRR